MSVKALIQFISAAVIDSRKLGIIMDLNGISYLRWIKFKKNFLNFTNNGSTAELFWATFSS